MNPDPPANDSFLRIDAAAIADGTGLAVGPASLLLLVQNGSSEDGMLRGRGALQAAGAPQEVDTHPGAARARVLRFPDHLLIPGLVNAHAHLDLTHIGPRPYRPDQGFPGFVEVVRSERHADAQGIAASVQLGAAMSRVGGVVALGDIGGAPLGRPSPAACQALRASSLRGASFLEFFAIGKGEVRGREAVASVLAAQAAGSPSADAGPIALGLQPHAPTTVALSTYSWLLANPAARGRRLSTHLAETPEEHAFIADAAGPQRSFLESLGLWDDRMLDEIGHGRTPVEHMAAILNEAPFLCAHVNDASDADIDLLARTPTSVAYCPRASAYFGAHEHFGPHRYRDMLSAGINVALGTDSIINLPAGLARLSTLDEARTLYRRDRTNPVTLLRMATIYGARGLGLDEAPFTFAIGARTAGIVGVPINPPTDLDPLAAALTTDTAPHLIFMGS